MKPPSCVSGLEKDTWAPEKSAPGAEIWPENGPLEGKPPFPDIHHGNLRGWNKVFYYSEKSVHQVTEVISEYVSPGPHTYDRGGTVVYCVCVWGWRLMGQNKLKVNSGPAIPRPALNGPCPSRLSQADLPLLLTVAPWPSCP